MSRFAIYTAREDVRPKRGLWPPLRIFAWVLLWSAMFFWGWVLISARG